jgi:hypothetical protein
LVNRIGQLKGLTTMTKMTPSHNAASTMFITRPIGAFAAARSSSLGRSIDDAEHENQRREHVSDHQPRLREVVVTDDGGHEPEDHTEDEQRPSDGFEPLLRREHPPQGADVAGSRHDADDHALADEDRDREEHARDVQELPDVGRRHRPR